MSVDVRTRIDGQVEPIESDAFLSATLPEAFERHSELLEEAAAAFAPPPLIVTISGFESKAWQLKTSGRRVIIEPIKTVFFDAVAHDHTMILRLRPEELDDLASDQVTPMGWFSSGRLDLKGRLEDLLDWWVLLRGALDGIAPHVPAGTATDGRDATDLEGHRRSFDLNNSNEELASFFERYGFLHIKNAFTLAEMARVSNDIGRISNSYSRGDGSSWWAKTAKGEDRLVRMQCFDQRSETVAALVDDDRLQRLATLTGDGHRWDDLESNRVEALIKPIGVVEGISDVPWHKDCSLGRHGFECCSLTVGISVTGADESSGQLRVLAGSHRTLIWPAFRRRGCDLRDVPLPTSAGDMTVHLSCTMHMAQPPVTTERQVLYTGFTLPPLTPQSGLEAKRQGRRRLAEVREAAPMTVSQEASPVS